MDLFMIPIKPFELEVENFYAKLHDSHKNLFLLKGIIEAAPPGQIQLIHKRLAKKYIHTDLEMYWAHPQDIGYGIYHLCKAGTQDIVYFLLINEISTLARLWDLSDIMLEALELATKQVLSFKPGSISLELFDLHEKYEMLIGAEDIYIADHSLSREYAYYLEINDKKSQIKQMREHSIKVLDRSSKLSSSSKYKMSALVWGDIAPLRYKEGNFLESIDALKSQIDLYTYAKVSSRISAAAWHNLGLIYQEKGDWSEAHKAL